MKIKEITYIQIKSAFEKRNYKFFESAEPLKPFNLNIFGIRSSNTSPNKFDDLIGIAYLDYGGDKVLELYPATTDPGRYWLLNPMNINGTAILKEEQYRGTFKLGLHHSDYLALVQNKPVKVYRDRDRDDHLDLDDSKIQEGMFGINIHRAASHHKSENVNKWSAGCQVIQDPKDFKEFIEICKTQNSRYGNSFTYSLLNEKDLL